MKHAVAALLCIALLAVMVGIFGLIVIGTYWDFALGNPIDPASLQEMLSPRYYRFILIAAVVAAVFAVLDIYALLSEPKGANSFDETPNSKPLAFVAVRFRRYLLPVIIVSWYGIESRIASEGFPTVMIKRADVVFAAAFFMARRPLNLSVQDVVKILTGQFQEFAKTLNRGS